MNLKDLPVESLPAGAASLRQGLLIGELLALEDDGRCAFVSAPELQEAAVRAECALDLHAAHIGSQVVLILAGLADPRPVVIAVLRSHGLPVQAAPDHVCVDADGRRLVISADTELVLRCGKSSVKLRRDGHVEIRGETVLTRAAGANRIRGGSIQLN